MDHTKACPYCPYYVPLENTTSLKPWQCSVYNSFSAMRMIRKQGCPMFPYREVPRSRGEYVDGVIVSGSQRPGQQKQKKADKQYNNAKARRKFR